MGCRSSKNTASDVHVNLNFEVNMYLVDLRRKLYVVNMRLMKINAYLKKLEDPDDIEKWVKPLEIWNWCNYLRDKLLREIEEATSSGFTSTA